MILNLNLILNLLLFIFLLCGYAGLSSAPIPPEETDNPYETSDKDHDTHRKRHRCWIEHDLSLHKEPGSLIVVRPPVLCLESIIANDMVPREHEFGRFRVEESTGKTTDIPGPE
jgi:hypothetical protein